MSSAQVLNHTIPLGAGDQFSMSCYNQFLLELLTVQGASGTIRGEGLCVALRIPQLKNHTLCQLARSNRKLRKTTHTSYSFVRQFC